MASAPSPNDLTRQQLDELDALLQRMLSLPLASADAARAVSSTASVSRPIVPELPVPEPPPPAPRPTPTLAYTQPQLPATLQPLNPRENTPTLWRGDPVSRGPIGPQLLTVPEPSEPAPAPAVRPAPVSRRGEPTTAPLAATNGFHERAHDSILPAKPSLISAQPAVAPTEPAPIRHEPVPAALQPLVALNRAVNFACDHLGAPGRILRSNFGKNTLAAMGIGLIAYTAAKVVQLQGWATLPFDLPWPS